MTTQPRSSPITQTPSRAGAIITLAIGAVLTIFGPILGILIGSFALVPRALGLADNTAHVAPTVTVELDVGESVFLLAPVADLSAVDHSACAAKTDDSTTAAISYEPASALNTLVNGNRYESFARVTAVEAGTYTLSCHTSVDVIFAPPFEFGSFLGLFGWWAAAGLLVSVVGIVLVILGIVRLATHTSATI